MSLEKIINKVKNGTFTPHQAINSIESYTNSVNRDQCERMQKISIRITERNEVRYGKSPEDILVEKENLEEAITLLKEIREFVGERNFSSIIYYYVNEMTYKEIGDMLGKTTQAIHRRVYLSLKAYIKHIEDDKEKLERIRDILVYIPTVVRSIKRERDCYTTDIYMNKTKPKEIMRNAHGHPMIRMIKSCEVKEMLNECFNDNKTTCGLCNKCNKGL